MSQRATIKPGKQEIIEILAHDMVSYAARVAALEEYQEQYEKVKAHWLKKLEARNPLQDELMSNKQVAERLGINVTSMPHKISSPRFPAPIIEVDNIKLWLIADIENYIANVPQGVSGRPKGAKDYENR